MQVISVVYGPNLGRYGGGSLGVNALIEYWNNRHNIIHNCICEFETKTIGSRLYEKFFLKGKKRKLRKPYHFNRFIKNILNKYDEDSIFICQNIAAAYGLIKNGRKVVLIYHGQGSPIYEARGFGATFTEDEELREKEYESVAFGKSILVGFPSIGARDAYLETSSFGLDFRAKVKGKSEIVYNCCNDINVVEPRPELKKLIKKSAGKKVILTVSTLNDQKGVDLIPEKLSTIKNFKRDYCWLLCGTSGNLKDNILQQIDRLGLQDNFIHVDYKVSQGEIGFLYTISSFYMMHHRVSIFDLATLEAMSFGLIPMLSAVGGNLEVNKQENIIFMEGGKSVQVPDTESEINRLSLLNKQVVNKYFSAKAFLEGYMRLAAMAERKVKNHEK